MREKKLVERLLSGSMGPSVQEKEDTWKKIISAVGPTKRQAPRWRAILVPMLATACVAVAVLLLWHQPQDQFSIRGGGAEAGIRISCGGASTGPVVCQPGATLSVATQPAPNTPFLSLAALSSKGVLVHYFPTKKLASMAIPAEGILDRGVILGTEHEPGHYKVFGIFSHRPLTPEEVVASIEARAAGKSTPSHKIVVTALEIRQP